MSNRVIDLGKVAGKPSPTRRILVEHVGIEPTRTGLQDQSPNPADAPLVPPPRSGVSSRDLVIEALNQVLPASLARETVSVLPADVIGLRQTRSKATLSRCPVEAMEKLARLFIHGRTLPPSAGAVMIVLQIQRFKERRHGNKKGPLVALGAFGCDRKSGPQTT